LEEGFDVLISKLDSLPTGCFTVSAIPPVPDDPMLLASVPSRVSAVTASQAELVEQKAQLSEAPSSLLCAGTSEIDAVAVADGGLEPLIRAKHSGSRKPPSSQSSFRSWKKQSFVKSPRPVLSSSVDAVDATIIPLDSAAKAGVPAAAVSSNEILQQYSSVNPLSDSYRQLFKNDQSHEQIMRALQRTRSLLDGEKRRIVERKQRKTYTVSRSGFTAASANALYLCIHLFFSFQRE
jgi:hypothetical protein